MNIRVLFSIRFLQRPTHQHPLPGLRARPLPQAGEVATGICFGIALQAE